jgi:hypothetical protein
MRARLSSPLVLLLCCSVMAGACGKLKPADATGTAGAGTSGAGGGGGTSGEVLVTVSGTVAPHPLNAALGATADFSMLKVSIVDPEAVIGDANAAPLGSMTVDQTTGNCDATSGCKFSLPGINITHQTLGLVGTLEDLRTGTARVWVKTGTGMGTNDFLTSVRKSPAPITNRRGFIVSRALEAKLVLYVNAVLGTTMQAGDLEARGFLIGHITGAAPADGSNPVPVAGATVVASGTAASGFDLIYPTADFTGKGTATSATGIFLVVPKAASPIVTTWTVVRPTGDTRTWQDHLAGTNPNNAFVIILPADDQPTDGGVDGGTDATSDGATDVATDGLADKPADGATDGATDAAVDHAGG